VNEEQSATESAEAPNGAEEKKAAVTIDTSRQTTELPTRSPKQVRSRAGTASKAEAMASGNDGDSEARLKSLAEERTDLRDQVESMRKEMEELQSQHAEALAAKQRELEQTQGEKEQADSNYQTLLGRVNTIRSQLGERLKADAV
jgi:uncharacterized protein (DUF3084 family)